MDRTGPLNGHETDHAAIGCDDGLAGLSIQTHGGTLLYWLKMQLRPARYGPDGGAGPVMLDLREFVDLQIPDRLGRQLVCLGHHREAGQYKGHQSENEARWPCRFYMSIGTGSALWIVSL